MKITPQTKFLSAILMLTLFFPSGISSAASAAVLGMQVKETMDKLKMEVRGADELLARSKGILVFPGIWKAGFGFGGQYGEGALLINGTPVDYYSIAGASFGFQMGVQKQSVIMVFLDETVLNEFRSSDGWEFGVDGSVAIIKVGVDGSIDSITTNEPVMAFVIGQKGLMYNVTLEGYKLTKIKK